MSLLGQATLLGLETKRGAGVLSRLPGAVHTGSLSVVRRGALVAAILGAATLQTQTPSVVTVGSAPPAPGIAGKPSTIVLAVTPQNPSPVGGILAEISFERRGLSLDLRRGAGIVSTLPGTGNTKRLEIARRGGIVSAVLLTVRTGLPGFEFKRRGALLSLQPGTVATFGVDVTRRGGVVSRLMATSPTFTGAQFVTPDVVQLGLTLPAVRSNQAVTPDVVTVGSVVRGDWGITAPMKVINLSVIAVDPVMAPGATTRTPPPVTLATAVPGPSATTGQVATPGVVTLSVTTIDVIVNQIVKVPPVILATEVILPAAGAQVATPDVIVLGLTVPAPGSNLGQVVTPDVAVVGTGGTDPTPAFAITVTPDVVTLVAEALDADRVVPAQTRTPTVVVLAVTGDDPVPDLGFPPAPSGSLFVELEESRLDVEVYPT